MTRIEIAQDEIEILVEILRKQLSDLTLETAFTHRKDFHRFLKRRKEFMEAFVGRLERELATQRREIVEAGRLGKVEILEGLAEGELQSIAQYFEEENVKPGFIFARRNENAGGVRPDSHFLKEGGCHVPIYNINSCAMVRDTHSGLLHTLKLFYLDFICIPNSFIFSN